MNKSNSRNKGGGAASGVLWVVGDVMREAWRDLKAGVSSFGPDNPKPQRSQKPTKTPAKKQAPGSKTPPPARRRRRRIPPAWLGEAALTGLSLCFIGAIAGLGVALFAIAPEPPDEADLWAVGRLPSVVILDRNGEEIAARGARYGEAVRIDDLPPYLVKAFLSTEDRRFYDHHGVDLRGILRAVVKNVRTGTIAEGGSTITQQLAKNLFLSPEQSYIRKAKEAMLAVWIEGRYEKNEILSLYLNRIYMGAGAYGIESAAKTYFGKSARDVTLAEAVMLAGLPKAPSSLAPTQNPFGAQDRALEVLDNLRETGDITDTAAREARENPPVVRSGAADREVGYFFDYVAERARDYAAAENAQCGAVDLILHTTLDAKMQAAAEAAVREIITTETKLAGADQAALIAYDNRTGAMRAMVGGRAYLESQFNRATQAKRQPGSAFKPFVYAAAFENGLSPETRLTDQPIEIAGWRPTNYLNRYDGPMRLTEAMARSVNTIAVQVSEGIGRPKVIEMARRLGISSDIPEAEAGVALGGFNATLEELTGAYLPFARGGMGAAPFAIRRIENERGELLYTHEPPQAERLMAEKVADDMTHMLYQVMAAGTGGRARLPRRQAVGKTGTTNDWRDAWFIGYTAQLTAGVWVGNDTYRPMKKVTGGTLPAEIWKKFMTAAHEDLPRARLDGAYAAESQTDNNALAGFYGAVARDLARIRAGERLRRRDLAAERTYREERPAFPR